MSEGTREGKVSIEDSRVQIVGMSDVKNALLQKWLRLLAHGRTFSLRFMARGSSPFYIIAV